MKTDCQNTNRLNVDAILRTEIWLFLRQLQLSGMPHASQS